MIRAASVLALLGAIASLAGCPKSNDKKPNEPTTKRDAGDAGSHLLAPLDGQTVTLPPAPPLPEVPAGLPAPPVHADVTAEAVALGELLFHDARLAKTGALACASCHDPARGYAGTRQTTAEGKQNLRRAPALVNLAWAPAFGWDGRYPSLAELLPAHVKGQLGDPLDVAIARVADLPLYRAHLARLGGTPTEAALRALSAFVLTRYAGDAPWDRVEATARVPKPGVTPDPIVAGYLVFTGKGQCAVCHPPPLYTDHAYHRVILDPYNDAGRGLVDKAQTGAFRTPTLRGAAARPAFMHTSSLPTLEAVVDAYLHNALTADDHPFENPIPQIRMSPAERDDLLAFLRALTAPSPAATRPALP